MRTFEQRAMVPVPDQAAVVWAESDEHDGFGRITVVDDHLRGASSEEFSPLSTAERIARAKRLPLLICERTAFERCPRCGSDDLSAFTADADTREDEADLTECNVCRWDAALTTEGLANLIEGRIARGDTAAPLLIEWDGGFWTLDGTLSDAHRKARSLRIPLDEYRIVVNMDGGATLYEGVPA